MEKELNFSVEEYISEFDTAVSADLTPWQYPNFPSPLATAFDVSTLNSTASTAGGIDASSIVSSYFTNTTANAINGNYYRFIGDIGAGVDVDISFTDILTGYTYIIRQSNSFGYSYDIGGYTNGNAITKYFNDNVYSSNTGYTSSTFYNVGNQNGYLNNFNNRTGVMNFVDVNISSFTRQNDYVSFDMGNGTSFQSQSSSSENDIFQYSTDGQNVSYAKLGFTDRNNTFSYTDGVNYIGSSNHEDTLSLNSYQQTVDLSGAQYVSVENIDARNSWGSNFLIGNANSNKIYGQTNDALWGGSGSGNSDELYGSGWGGNTYYYGLNEGNDVIYNSVSTDKVNLYNMSVTDIVSADTVGSNLVLNMAGGESLTVVGQNGASNFVFSDQSEYSYNRQASTWQRVR